MSIINVKLIDIFKANVPSVPVTFTGQQTPFIDGTKLVTSFPRTVTTASDGTATVTLEPGTYLVTFGIPGNTDKITIGVPNDSATYALTALINAGTTLPNPPGVSLQVGNNLADVANAETAFTAIKQAATTGGTGVVQIATQAEVNTGTDPLKSVTPDTLKNSTQWGAKEAALGNPGTDGYILSSTAAGVRSWVAQSGGGGGSVSALSPDDGSLSGLVLWLKAGDLSLSNGDIVTNWPDASGNGNNATATSGNEPTFNTFDGFGNMTPQMIGVSQSVNFASAGSQYLTLSIPFILSSPFSLFTVLRVLPGNTIFVLASSDNNVQMPHVMRDATTGETAIVLYNGSLMATPYRTASSPTLFEVSDDATHITIKVNGVQVGTQSSMGGFNLARIASLAQFGVYGDGAIAEIVVFNTALTEPQIAGIREYLRQKYTLF